MSSSAFNDEEFDVHRQDTSFWSMSEGIFIAELNEMDQRRCATGRREEKEEEEEAA